MNNPCCREFFKISFGTVVVTDGWDTALHLFLSVGSGICLALILLGLIFYYHWRNQTAYRLTDYTGNQNQYTLVL